MAPVGRAGARLRRNEQPGGKLRLSLESADSFESGQKRVLDGVVGVFFVREKSPGDSQEPPGVGANAHFEGDFVAGLRAGQQGRLVLNRANLAGWGHLFHLEESNRPLQRRRESRWFADHSRGAV
jgi:hypothetical protein